MACHSLHSANTIDHTKMPPYKNRTKQSGIKKLYEIEVLIIFSWHNNSLFCDRLRSGSRLLMSINFWHGKNNDKQTEAQSFYENIVY